jgi:hypothetical protein
MVWEMLEDDVEGVCDGKTKYPLMKLFYNGWY